MALFGWLRRLFTHTAATPPFMPVEYQPAGLERPDPPETLIPPSPALETAPETSVDPSSLGEAGAPNAPGDLPSGVVVTVVDRAIVPATSLEERPATRPQRPSKGRETDGFGEAVDDDVYGLTFAIEYEAANGDFSRRRIMLRSISIRDEGTVFLRALCFERNALRFFRLDRVQSIIDADGAVHEDAAAFLRDELRVSLKVPAIGNNAATRPQDGTALPGPELVGVAGSQDHDEDKPGVAQRRVTRDGLRVLCALGRADGLLHPAEVEVVLDYIEAACRAEDEQCGAEDRAALAPYIRRQRPGLDVLEACLLRIEARDPAARFLLLDHAERLIVADGQDHDAELCLLAAMRQSG